MGALTPEVDHRFPNGSRVVISTGGQAPGTGAAQVASVQLWVAAGTCAERDDEHGCAHLLEHMLFKPRPVDVASEAEPVDEDLATAIEAVGGDVNAYTSYDETVFHATVPLAAATRAAEAMMAAVLDPAFDAEELAKEREVVVEEILQYDDDPAASAMDHLIEDLFAGHDYGRPILGRVQEVRAHGVKQLRRYHRRNYAGARLTLVVTGAVDPGAIVEVARGRLEGRPARKPLGPPPGDVPVGAPSVHVEARDVREAHVRLGWVGPGARDERAVALDLAATALGHGESSPLAARVRRERSLVSDAHASYLPFAHRGVWLVSAQTVPDRVEAAARGIMDEIVRLARVPLERDAFERARAQLQSSLVYRRETVQGQASALGFFATVCGSLEAEARYYEALEQLDAQTVRREVARLVDESRAVLHVVVPESSEYGSAKSGRALRQRLRTTLRGPTRRAVPAFEVDARGVHATTLPHGLRLAVLPDSRIPIVGGLLVWPGGLRLEPARIAGATHLATALLTRGTERRDGETLAREIDDMAAVLEGFAGRNSVGLQFESLAHLTPTLVRRAVECAALPRFVDKEFEEERRVTIEEIEADEDDLGFVAFRAMLTSLYAKHPYGRSVRGTADSLPRLSPKVLHKLWSSDYDLGDATMCLAGDVDPEALRELLVAALDDDLGERPARRRRKISWPGRPPREPSRARRKTVERQRAQAHVAIGFPGLCIGDPRQATLDVLTTILGGQSGRLFIGLRERDGLVYHAGASSTEGIDAGHVSIYAATAQEKLAKTHEAIWREVASLGEELASSAEFDRARAWLVGNHTQGLQRRSRLAAHLAFAEAYDLGRDYYFDVPRRLAKVTRRGVRDLAAELLIEGRSVTATVKAPSS